MPDSNDTSAAGPDAESLAGNMPFTHMIREADGRGAAYRHDHPDQVPKEAPTPFEDTELGKVMIDTEARVAQDYAAGRISQDEFDRFTHHSQELVDHYGSDVKGVFNDLDETAKDWRQDAKDAVQEYRDSHPAVETQSFGDVSVADAADLARTAVDLTHPVVDAVFDHVDQFLDVAKTDLPDAAHQLVEARAEMHGVSDAEIHVLEARADSGGDEFVSKVEAGQRSLHEAQDHLDADFDKVHDALEQVHSYGESHPDSTINSTTDLTDHHLQEQQVHDTGVTDV